MTSDQNEEKPGQPVSAEGLILELGAAGTRTEYFIPFKNPKALISYYCAIFSLIPGLGLVLGPAAQITGIMGLIQDSLDPSRRGGRHAIFGMALGMITTLLNWSALVAILLWIYVYGVPGAAEPQPEPV
jgi:hypothetical protein